MRLPVEGPLGPKPRNSGLLFPPPPPQPFCAQPHGARTGAGPDVAPGPRAGLGSLCSRSADTWCPPARGSACLGREAARGPPGPDGTGRGRRHHI